MKYYKLLTKQGYPDNCYIIDKIYPETFKRNENCESVLEMQRTYPNDWQEVSELDYCLQEGIMPKYFAIKRVENNPLWGKYINWLNKTYSKSLGGGSIDSYYGFGGKDDYDINFYEEKLEDFYVTPIELTLEQWDNIINKKEEVMDKEIVGWKLKDACKQYEQAALKIVDQKQFYNFIEGYNFSTDSCNKRNLKKAGVLELWFEPCYKEKTLQFGGYDVTFKKVTSGVRITCNDVTGTFSQVEKIYDFITEKGKPFKFGNQDLKSFSYDDGSNWSTQYSDTCQELTIGCATGTWEEFVAIYEKAKSML